MSDENFTDENLFDAAGAVNSGPGVGDTEAEEEVVDYSEDDIRTLDWKEHIRRRPGMYIGKLGDGSNFDDGIYVLIKEVLDNGIDEFMMGYGRQITLDVEGGHGDRARLWPRHPAGQGGGCVVQDEYRREV